MSRLSEETIRNILATQSPATLIEVYTASYRLLGKANPEQALRLLDSSPNVWEGIGKLGQRPKTRRVYKLFPATLPYRVSEASSTVTGPRWAKSHRRRCLFWKMPPND